jgi:hypothetical protein
MPDRPAMLTAANERLRYAGAATAPAVVFAWAVLQNWAARSWAFAKVAARKTATVAKRVTIAVLVATERTLLSHSGRERTQAFAVWALILAFGVTSVDYLLTGGPEFSSGARAAPYVAHTNLIAARSPRPATELEFAAPVDLTAVSEETVGEATVTPAAARVSPPQQIGAQPPKAEIERVEGQAERSKAKPETAAT